MEVPTFDDVPIIRNKLGLGSRKTPEAGVHKQAGEHNPRGTT